MVRVGVFWGAMAAVAACGGGDAAPDASFADAPAPSIDAVPPTVRAVFEPPVPGAGADWGAMPYPSDLYLDADGFIALQTLPTGPNANEEYTQYFLDRIGDMTGAGVKTNVYFPVDGEIDPATLTGNVKVVDLDGDLAELPIDVVWRSDLGCIVAAPAFGALFRQDRRYAAYVTNAVTATDGTGLGRAAAFEAALTETAPADPAIAAVRDNLQPLFEALSPEVADAIADATVFTTANVTDEMKALRDAAAAAPPAVSAVQARTDLDEIFGVQDPAATPGWSVNGYRAQPHGNVATVVQGTITLTSFTTDTPGVAGLIEFDGNGAPIPKGTEDVLFTLTLPVAASYDQLPVMVHYGTFGGSRSEILYAADVAAAHGIAILAIDAPFHGDRLPGNADEINEVTGADGPDGFAESNQAGTVIRFLQFEPSGGLRALDTRVTPDNTRQAAADVSALVAFVRDGDVGPINTALTAAGLPGDLAFHPSGPALSGDSIGSMFMAIVAAVEPNADVVMLDVPPGGVVFPTFVHSTKLTGLNAFWYELFDMRDRIVLDEQSPNSARFDPITMFWGDLLQKGESLPYAPYIATGELRGDSGPHIVINEMYDDEWVHNQATEWLAGVIGVPQMKISLPDPPPEPGLRFASFDEVTAPVAGNMPNGTTGALLLWNPGTHGFMFVLENLIEYEPGFPPFVKLDPPVVVVNPTLAAQTMRARFFSDYFAGDTPVARDPF